MDPFSSRSTFRKISQVVLDIEDLYVRDYKSSWESSHERTNYRTLGIFSKKPNKQKIIMEAHPYRNEDEEIVELLNCNYLLENQQKATDKFLKVAKIVETIFRNEILYSRYLTKEQVKSYKNY